jgi:hypothetical protein
VGAVRLGGGDKHPPQLVGGSEIAEDVQRAVYLRDDKEDPLAAALDLQAAGVALHETAGEWVKRDECLG